MIFGEAYTFWEAYKLTSNGLLVLKGSLMKIKETNALAATYVKIRQALINKGIVKLASSDYVFQDDYEFNSPSQAAAVILGYSVNGRVFWKDKKGKTLKEIEQETVNVEPK